MTLQVSNLLYVDQPTGTGFSYTSDRRDIRHNEEGVSNDLYDFLQVCLSILNQYCYDRYLIQ
jgi:serine carboxypeptidase-like clade 4